MTRPRFRQDALDEAYERVGYVIVPGAARPLVGRLRQLHREVASTVSTGFHSTLYSADVEVKRHVHDGILECLLPVIDAILAGYRPLLCNFITKSRGPAGAMAPHQDWTFVDERRASSMNFWVPLVDVDGRNGAMSVLPRGHLVPFTIRGTDTMNAFREIEEVAAAQMVELPMRAGDVLVHDHRVLHSSPPNQRRRARVVAGCALIAAESEPIHYRQVAPLLVDRYEIDERFFTEHTFGAATLPACAQWAESVTFENPVLDESQLPQPVFRSRHPEC